MKTVNNMITFRGKQYNIVGFYRYPSFVQVEEKYNYIDKVGNQDLQGFYNACAKQMQEYERSYNLNFHENKTAFVLEPVEEEDFRNMYIAEKDFYYVLGYRIRTFNVKYFDFKELCYKPVIKSQIIQWQQRIIQDRKLLLADW